MVGGLRDGRGHTLIEMVVTISVMAILASAILPLAAMTAKREREIELRRALRDIRSALDLYHELCLASAGGGGAPVQGTPQGAPVQSILIKIEDDPGRVCYPKDLDVLLEGVETNVPRYQLKFLRSIPRDPFNASGEEHDGHGWIFRSTTEDPDAEGSWNRQNVFDVRSSSESQALDGSYYKDW